MDQSAHAYPGSFSRGTGIPDVRVRIRGLPEDVQRIADGVEAVFPGTIVWCSAGIMSIDDLIEVSGTGTRSS